MPVSCVTSHVYVYMGRSLHSGPFWGPYKPYYIGDLRRDPNLENYP